MHLHSMQEVVGSNPTAGYFLLQKEQDPLVHRVRVEALRRPGGGGGWSHWSDLWSHTGIPLGVHSDHADGRWLALLQ